MLEQQLAEPIVYNISDNLEALEAKREEETDEHVRSIMFDYPIIYIHYREMDQYGRYEAYVGETTDVIRRTGQHLQKADEDHAWQKFLKDKKSRLYVIGHDHFNKSLTLDLENKFILYLSCMGTVRHLCNGRGNPQNQYYTLDERDALFSAIWAKLHEDNSRLFAAEKEIADMAIFKASPFHFLSKEQLEAKDKIIDSVYKNYHDDKIGQLIVVAGEAGSGKTVLNSKVFYELCSNSREAGQDKLDCYMIVNQDEQLKVYKQIANRLDNLDRKCVMKATKFIDQKSPDHPADIVFIDEAHLLWTQYNQGYSNIPEHSGNQLQDILARSRTVVAVFDAGQILRTQQFWEPDKRDNILAKAVETIHLKNQMRIRADSRTVQWIRDMIDKDRVGNIPEHDSKGYDIHICSTPQELEEAVLSKNTKDSLSRMLATYDWPYADAHQPKGGGAWSVKIGDWEKPWNYQLQALGQTKTNKSYESWAEIPESIGEIGSTYTIHGFDLNYAGVILGPSVQFRDGKIIHVAEYSCNSNATQKRTLSNNEKQSFADDLLKNEMNVLLTRGVEGLYIYACDDALREELLKAERGEVGLG